MSANENNENQEARPVAPLMEKQIVETTEQELRVDGHHLIDKKQKSFIDANEIGTQIFQGDFSSDMMFFETMVVVHIRTIDDKSYKVTEINGHEAVERQVETLERQVETDMTEDEVKQFEEDWTNMWNPDITQKEIEKLHQ